MTAKRLVPRAIPREQKRPSITIVVVPRERFSYTQQSLESIYNHTHVPFELVYVDAGSPQHIRRYLRQAANKQGFTLLRSEHFLSPNQARNLGLSQATTDYVVFIDNDVHVSPGWLTSLWRCAQETNATVVSPITCIGQPLHEQIHSAGGEARIFMDLHGNQIRRCLYEKRFLVNHSAAAVQHQLYRRTCEFAELHCLLIKRDLFGRLGPFDEQLLGTQEDMDFCLSINRLGTQIICEPDSVVTYVPQKSYRWSDMAYFMLRWSDIWEVESLMHFQQKWDLDMDNYFLARYKQLGHRRHQAFLYPLLRQVTGHRAMPWLDALATGVERWLNQVICDRYTQLSNHIVIQKWVPAASSHPESRSRHRATASTTRLSEPRLIAQ